MAIIAVILEMFGNWLIGSKRRWGFLVKIAGSVAWLLVAVLTGILGLVISAGLGIAISCRNYFKWGRGERSETKAS